MEQTQALTLTQLSFFQSHVASLSDGRSVSPSGEKCLIIKQEVVGTHSELHGDMKRAQFRPFTLYPCQCPMMGRWPKSMTTMSTARPLPEGTSAGDGLRENICPGNVTKPLIPHGSRAGMVLDTKVE